MKKNKASWYVYIINSTDDSLYTGISTDVVRRWYEHCYSKKGAKYFRSRKPTQLLFVCESVDRSSATKLEMSLKKMSRAKKLLMINSSQNIADQFLQDIKKFDTNIYDQ